MKTPLSIPFLAAVFCLVSLWASEAQADTLTIKREGAHPRYSFEAEPHLALGIVSPPGPAIGNGFGVGFRGTVEIADRGFIARVNDSVGISFGLDWIRYGSRTNCVVVDNFRTCTDVDFNFDYFWLPVTMQWNFWLSRNWSVFGEPGFALRYIPDAADDLAIDPVVLYVGGRFHFSDRVTLTMRLGYPTFTVGVSFLL